LPRLEAVLYGAIARPPIECRAVYRPAGCIEICLSVLGWELSAEMLASTQCFCMNMGDWEIVRCHLLR
jgi:hypothetical protein